jgi:sterol desaturase/sphingolipid hydroxylase (fatty acid hydroxylase superfamily)
MIRSRILSKVGAELGTPRESRPFGSGWLSGSVGMLAGAVGLLMTIALRYPGLLTVPELGLVRDSSLFRPAIYFVLVSGYLLAALSLMLRKDMTLGLCGMVLTLAATIVGSLPPRSAIQVEGMFLGLDFFVLNVLFMGLLFVPLERLFAQHKQQVVLREEWREDLFYYLISSMFVQVLTFLTLAPSTFVVAHGHFDGFRAWTGGLPWVLQFVVIVILTDFAQYWVHRAFHQIPFLWRFHAVHHSAKSMDWIAGARMHFVEIIVLRSLTAMPMFVLGFEESAIQAYILFVYIYSAFIHANVGGNFGFVEKLVVLPRYHHWHHGVEREAIDVNFAIHLPLLDRMFGTQHMPEGRWPSGYGIKGHPVPNGYWKQFLYPFRRKA